jgi:hypothetical protein
MARSGVDDFADDVFRLLVASGNNVGLGTVYRRVIQTVGGFIVAGVLLPAERCTLSASHTAGGAR